MKQKICQNSVHASFASERAQLRWLLRSAEYKAMSSEAAHFLYETFAQTEYKQH